MGRSLRSILLTALACVGAVAFGGWFWWATTPVDIPEFEPAVGEDQPEKEAVVRAVRPSPRTWDDYVGDQACAACHQEIAQKYAASAMGRSLALVHKDATLRTLNGEVSIRPGGKCTYHVRRVGTDILEHAERMADSDGELIYDFAVPIHYVLGSGTRGRSYLTNHDGVLLTSCLTWYANGERWDLSPGYLPDDPRLFARPVIHECLSCHAGRVATAAGMNRYATNPFPQAAIGCENCHGPGQRHVATMTEGAAASGNSIVNPSKLGLAERESVCNQCHLQGAARIPRYGRTHFDFRPGDRLEETQVVLVTGTGVEEGKTEAVRHVQQMMGSKCFTGSRGQLGCTSCHDAHATVPKEEATAFYRQRCLACHEVDDCRSPAADREARQDSCFACHMPRLPTSDIAHTALTDHRVLARAAEAPVKAPAAGPERLLFFDGAEKRLPDWEVTRASGLGLVKRLLDEGRVPDLGRIESMLAPVLEVAPDDTRVMNSLTEVALKSGDLATAESYSRQALAVDPQNEPALVALTQVCYQTGRYADGLEFCDRALAINPMLDTLHAHRADMLRLTGRLADGTAAAERALQLNPRLLPVRRWLVHAYRESGQPAKSKEHAELLRRIEEAPPAE
jgi:hypothetical protein